MVMYQQISGGCERSTSGGADFGKLTSHWSLHWSRPSIVTVWHCLYRNMCARWTPIILTEKHKNRHFEIALSHLQRFREERNELLDSTATDDETWARHFTPQKKRRRKKEAVMRRKHRKAKHSNCVRMLKKLRHMYSELKKDPSTLKSCQRAHKSTRTPTVRRCNYSQEPT